MSNSGSPFRKKKRSLSTLHLVNASFTSGDLSYTYQMTGLIEQMIAVVEQASHKDQLDQISIARFITHLRYLFVRIAQHKQLAEKPGAVSTAIMEAYPESVEVAYRLAELVELRLGESLTEDEVSYLVLHVARLRN